MQRLSISLLMVCLMAATAFGQGFEEDRKDETIFSNSSVKLTGLWGGNTTNLNEDNGDYGLFHGGYFLFEFNKDYTVGWQGYGFLEDDLEFDYNGLRLGYAHRSHKVVHPAFSLFAGTGKIETRDEDTVSDNVLTFLPMAGVEINVLRWFRIGFEGGYQFVFNSDIPDYSDSDVSQPFLGVRFKFGYSWGD